MGVVIPNNCTVDVEPERAVPTAVTDVSAALREQKWSILFRLQCPSG